ncbi:thermonuclease family protein [Chloroflexota bacterium]
MRFSSLKLKRSGITKRAWFLVIIFFLLLPLCSCSSLPDTARVIQVIDGDTITIEGGYRVRYIGIDTPEVHPDLEAFGVEAWQANRNLVEGREVRLERDVSEKDKYGRLLRYVWVDDILVNAELVKKGLARAKAYPPDTKYQDYFEQMEVEAREAEWGMWAK